MLNYANKRKKRRGRFDFLFVFVLFCFVFLFCFLFLFVLFCFVFVFVLFLFFVFFFASKEAYPIVRQLKNYGKKKRKEGSKMREKQMLGPKDPSPLVT